jgi:hypothetical protein
LVDIHSCSQRILVVENPFRPTAGATPPEVIGRAGILDEFEHGLTLGSGAPGLLTIFTGARGIGKTVMLSAAQDLATEHGWAVISETANGAFMGRIGESMRRLAEELGDGPQADHIGEITGGSSVAGQLTPEQQVDWRCTGGNLLRPLNARGTGLIITVDEIHAADRDELAHLAATIQHSNRDRLPVGLVVAGLPAAVAGLLEEDAAAFLRPADRIELQSVPVTDVEKSFARTFAASGFDTTSESVHRAADATGGYPFLVQLVGYYLWREAEINDRTLTADAVDRGIERAHQWNARTVLASALSALSPRDIDFLRAMAVDDVPSTDSDVGRRMGAKASQVANYRARLMAAGLIEAPGQGQIDFAIPGLRRHLRALRQE